MLVEIKKPEFDVEHFIAYATEKNVTGKKIYKNPLCYLHKDAADKLKTAIKIAAKLGLRFKIFDAYRPVAAQWALWNFFPSTEFVSDPKIGGPHNRGVAVDLTLIDQNGLELEMGTPFDDFTKESHHGADGISNEAVQNRLTLLGIMTDSGFDFFRNEWWHYQLFNSKTYPVLDHVEMGLDMM